MDDDNMLSKIMSVSEVRETAAVDLGDYHESYRGAIFEVWVTPTKAHQKRFGEIQEWLAQAGTDVRVALERMDRQNKELISRLREEGKTSDVLILEAEYQKERAIFDERAAARMQEEFGERLLVWIADTCLNWGRDEMRQARDHLLETNPAAWEWLWNRITQTIGDYKRRQLKNSAAG